MCFLVIFVTHKGKWKRVHANMTIVHFKHAVAFLAFEKKR